MLRLFFEFEKRPRKAEANIQGWGDYAEITVTVGTGRTHLETTKLDRNSKASELCATDRENRHA